MTDLSNIRGTVVVDTQHGPNLMPRGRFFPSDGGLTLTVEGSYALGGGYLAWRILPENGQRGYAPEPVAVIWKGGRK